MNYRIQKKSVRCTWSGLGPPTGVEGSGLRFREVSSSAAGLLAFLSLGRALIDFPYLYTCNIRAFTFRQTIFFKSAYLTICFSFWKFVVIFVLFPGTETRAECDASVGEFKRLASE